MDVTRCDRRERPIVACTSRDITSEQAQTLPCRKDNLMSSKSEVVGAVLDDLRSHLIEEAIEDAPRFDRFSDAFRHATKVIHGLPALMQAMTLENVEVYIGRTALTVRNVHSRWTSHRNEKNHEFGVVLFSCPTRVVANWEKVAISVIKRLEQRRNLCVANAVAGGGGGLPDTPQSCVYMTWRYGRRRTRAPVRQSDLDDLALDVNGEVGGDDRTFEGIRRAIDLIASPGNRIRVVTALPDDYER